MQPNIEKLTIFKKAIGNVVNQVRLQNPNKISMSKLANEYEITKSTLSIIENGYSDPRISTLWKIAEARGMKFSEFALRLEKELGEDFMFMDE